MRRSAIAASCLFVALGASRADFTILNYPGAEWTQVNGISGNTAVGVYAASTGGIGALGFVYNGGHYTSLSAPWANDTIPSAIDGKNIVGQTYGGYSGQSGFLYNGSTWTPLSFPGATVTKPLGISGNTIIGTYYTATSPNPSSFLYNGSTWTTFGVPGALQTLVAGIDGKNIVGSWIDSAGSSHNFLYNGSSWTSLNVPGGPMAISGNTIVGQTLAQNGVGVIGYLYNGQTSTLFNFPGSTQTVLYGVSGANVVGTADLPSSRYGPTSFLYTADAPEPSSLTLMALGALGAAACRWRSGKSHLQAMICLRRAI